MRPFLAQEDVWEKMFPGGVWEKLWGGREIGPVIPPPPGAEGRPLWARPPEGAELRRPLPFSPSPRVPRPWMSGSSPHTDGFSWPLAGAIAVGALVIGALSGAFSQRRS